MDNEESDDGDDGQRRGANKLSLSSVEGKGSFVSRVGCFQVRWSSFSKRLQTQARTLASKRQAKAIRASHGPRVSPQFQAEEKVRKNNGNSRGKSQGTEGAIQGSEGSGNGKTLKSGISSLDNLKPETRSENQESC